MFEEARNQLEQQITQAEANPPTEAPAEASPETASVEAKSPEEIADLSKFKKVLLDGEELSPEDLKKQRMFENDYRRKTMELAEQRRQHQESAKFDLNFSKDFDVVMQKPWLAGEFYKIYPPQYHASIKQIEAMYRQNPGLWTQGESAQERPDNSQNVEKIIEDRINRALKPFQEKEQLEQHKAHLAQIDAIESRMMQKYKRANRFEVYAAAEYLSNNGKELSDKDWEGIYKESHARNLAMIKQAYAEDFNQQNAANQKLKGLPPGGGIPGEAPVVPKTIKEAKEMALKQLEKRQ